MAAPAGKVRRPLKGKPGPKPGKARSLDPRQRRFCELLVLEGLTAGDAYLGAGYESIAGNGARANACRLRQLPHVATYIRKLQEQLGEESLDRRERWLAEVRHLAYVDLGAFYGPDGSLLPVEQLPEHARRALVALEVLEGLDGKPRGRRIKLADKLKSLELLGKAEGWLKEEIAVRGHVTLEQLVTGKGADDGEA